MARMSSEEAGTRAWDVLAGHHGGVNRNMWCYHGDLSKSQLARGIDWLRDIFGQEPFVMVRRGGENIYCLATNEADGKEHWERRLRGQITRARRDHNLAHGLAAQFPTEENTYQEELARRRLFDLRHAYSTMFSANEQAA